MDPSLDTLRGIFFDEAADQVAVLEAFAAEGREDVDTAFRAAHTLKGAAATIGLNDLAAAAHALEDDLDQIRRGFKSREALAQPLAEVVELLRMARHGESCHEIQLAIDAACPLPSVRAKIALMALAQLGEVRSCEPDPERATDSITIRLQSSRPWSDLVAAIDEIPEVRLSSPSTRSTVSERRNPERRATVRVPVDRIDEIVRISGELYTERRRLSNLVAALGDSEGVKPLRECADRLWRLSGTLHECAVRSRLMPLQGVLKRFPKLAEELATKLGKVVRAEVRGGDIEIDRATLDNLSDPLIHLVRNAVDHGIEPTRDRVAAGKPEIGHIEIVAEQLGHAVCLRVRDDGRGIDPDTVCRLAIERGLVDESEAASMSDQQKIDWVLAPGFSTASEVTDVSGRGVGMDLVHEAVRAVGGRLTIESSVGAGTTVSMFLPLTLAVLPCLIVRSGPSLWAIPTTHLLSTSLTDDAANLAQALGLEPDFRPRFAFTCATKDGGLRTFSVASLVSEESLVAKPISGLPVAHPAVHGAAVLPDGCPIVILNPLHLEPAVA